MDAGVYQCLVKNEIGAILSNPIKISFGCKFLKDHFRDNTLNGIFFIYFDRQWFVTMAISMLDIYFYSCIVLGEFSNVKDADVNAPEYEGAVMQCSNIAYKPGQSSINNYRSIDSMIDPPLL